MGPESLGPRPELNMDHTAENRRKSSGTASRGNSTPRVASFDSFGQTCFRPALRLRNLGWPAVACRILSNEERKSCSSQNSARIQPDLSCPAGRPPISQTIRHSSSETGCTDNREFLTSVISASRGSGPNGRKSYRMGHSTDCAHGQRTPTFPSNPSNRGALLHRLQQPRQCSFLPPNGKRRPDRHAAFHASCFVPGNFGHHPIRCRHHPPLPGLSHDHAPGSDFINQYRISHSPCNELARWSLISSSFLPQWFYQSVRKCSDT